MSYSYVKERNRRRGLEFDEDRDPNCAADLQDSPAAPDNRKILNPDSNWALASHFAESTKCSLDLSQKRRLAGYMTFLLDVRKLPPDRIREMVSSFTALTRNRYVASPVGYFTYLEDQLISRTEPSEFKSHKDYSGWSQPVRTQSKEYAWQS